MGDLSVGEGFIDAVMIRVTATGAAALGLAPTCTLTRLSTGARVGLTVAEVSDGIYKVTDMVPGADDEWLTEWAVAGAYTIYQAFKLFKVGGGVIADWEDGGRLDLIIDTLALEATLAVVDGLVDDIIADIGVFPTANYGTLAAYVEDIRSRLIVILADVTGLAGAAMRGTDGAALVADGWDAALATILDNFTALRIGYLEELDFDLQGYLDSLDTLIDGIIADIGVFPSANYATLAAYVEDIRTRLIAIVGDTDEIQISLADGGFTDLLIDSIIERTSNLPDDPADASVIAAAHALLATETKQDIIDGIVDTLLTRITAAVATEAKQDIIDGLIDGLIADIGVFPTGNYATIAAYVEDIRTRLIAILADVTGIAGAAMRGTDGAALVASGWDAPLATILDNFTALRIGYLEELDFALQEAIAALQTDLDNPNQYKADLTTLETRLSAARAGYLDTMRIATFVVSASVVDDVANTASTFETDLANVNNDYYNDMILVFTSGADVIGQARRILDYDGGTKFITVSAPLNAEPADGDDFQIVPQVVAAAAAGGDATAANQATIIALLDPEIAGIIADIGVFPSANYATFAAYVEDIRTRLIAIVGDTNELQISLADGGFTDLLIDSIIERTSNLPDDPADASDIAAAHALLATEAKQDIIDGIVDDIKGMLVDGGFTDLLIDAIKGVVDDILVDTGTTLENRQDTIASDVAEGKLRAFRRTYGFATTSESVSNAAEVSLAAPAVVTVNIPAGATLLEAKVVASLKANNQTAAEHNIGVTLQENIDGGGWADLRDLTANPPLTLPEVDATADGLTLVEVITSPATGETVQFRFQVDSDDAGEVHYTQTFVLSVEYDFQ